MKKLRIPFKKETKRGSFSLFFLFFSIFSFSQQKTITGHVKDSAGVPLVGVTVSVKGTAVGVNTNAEGIFSINVPASASALLFSYIGYKPYEAAIQGNIVNAILQINVTNAGEEVVVIGYGASKRKDLTGSISSVTSAQIEKMPVTSAGQAIQGRAAGVQVINNDGAPGGNLSVVIRGIGSLSSGNGPLYVVDGYPGTGLGNINPNDIATIDILKDPSATAIYGVRAANGIVMVTTKRGAKNKTVVSADMFSSFQTVPKLYEVLDAQQFAKLSNEAKANDITNTYKGFLLGGQDKWSDPSALHSVDWQSAFYKPANTQNYSAAIRGGNDKTQAAFSAAYYDQKGIVIASYYKRFNLGLNLDFQPYKWLKSSTSLKYSYVQNRTAIGSGNGGLGQLLRNPPTLDFGNSLTNKIKDELGNYGFYNPTVNAVRHSNPIYGVETNQGSGLTQTILANSSLAINLYDGLKFTTNFGVSTYNFSSWSFSPEDKRLNQQYPSSIPTLANYRQELGTGFEWVWENTLAYDKTFGQHTINFVAGVSAQKNEFSNSGGTGVPPNNVIRDLSQIASQLIVFGTSGNVNSLASEFARINYRFSDKYIITGTVRRDGSSKFDSTHQYGVFPSGSVAWKIINEPFMRSVSFLSDLKLRASYGSVGNNAGIGDFKYLALFRGNIPANTHPNNYGYPFNEIYQNGYVSSQPANPNLEWETNTTLDIGIDASFLNGALTFTADWFDRRSKNFLLNLPAPAQTGYFTLARNVGSMSNKGFEIGVNYSGNKGKDFTYGIGLTLSSIKNKLISLRGGTNYAPNLGGLTLDVEGWDRDYTRSYVGQPVGQFFGYKALGIIQTKAEIDALNAKAPGGKYYQALTGPGDRLFADINGDGKVDAEDRTTIGNPQPKFFGGINFDGAYKNWDFNVFFYGTYGNKILNFVRNNMETFQKRRSEGVQNVSVDFYNNHWTPTNPSNRYTRILYTDVNTANSVASDVWVEDGSYLKLRNLSIGYALPSNVLNKYKITKLRVYASAQNLFTITKYGGPDPEIGGQGGQVGQTVDTGIYPSSRTFTLGLNITF